MSKKESFKEWFLIITYIIDNLVIHGFILFVLHWLGGLPLMLAGLLYMIWYYRKTIGEFANILLF